MDRQQLILTHNAQYEPQSVNQWSVNDGGKKAGDNPTKNGATLDNHRQCFVKHFLHLIG